MPENKTHIPAFIVCENFNSEQTFVVSTKSPIMIAEVTKTEEGLKITPVTFDPSLSLMTDEKVSKLLNRMIDWYYFAVLGERKK